MTGRRSLGRFGVVGVLSISYCLGCAAPKPEAPKSMWRSPQDQGKRRAESEIDPTKVETRDDIFQIVQFWPQMPWLQHTDRIVGFKVTVYFRSGETRLGAFVPGTIFAWIYELEPDAHGRRERKLAHMWEFDQAEALGYRVRKRSIQGYYYGFPLRWDDELRLEGKLIEIQLGYERRNKQLVLSEHRQFRVPVPAGYVPPDEETEP